MKNVWLFVAVAFAAERWGIAAGLGVGAIDLAVTYFGGMWAAHRKR
jgi:hypothetical protein